MVKKAMLVVGAVVTVAVAVAMAYTAKESIKHLTASDGADKELDVCDCD